MNNLKIDENFDYIYKSFRIALYRHIFNILEKRDTSLSATDFFSVETIYLLGNPTITEFANMLCISQPNATYRIKSLIDKGYIEKQKSEKGNTFRLCVTEKFHRFYHEDMGYGSFILKRLSARLDEKALKDADELIAKVVAEIRNDKGEL